MNSARDLGCEVLKNVSRSFYLTLRALPPGLRAPISLAYLLARASDTIADSSDIPAEARAGHLRAFRKMTQIGANPDEIKALQTEIVPPDAGERVLIAQLDRCFAWLEKQSAEDRSDIVEVLAKITRGQELDVLRFQNPARLAALQNGGELEEYTYLVAGCVGEFWTRMCFRHARDFARADEAVMREWGANFGKGLQLVNILRDIPADLRAGRCYLPADELAAAGSDPRKPADAVFNRWMDRATHLLESGFRYIEATRSPRLRLACFLPWHLGVQTLVKLRRTPPLSTDLRVKVSRGEVRATLLLGCCAALSGVVLRRARARLESRLISAEKNRAVSR